MTRKALLHWQRLQKQSWLNKNKLIQRSRNDVFRFFCVNFCLTAAYNSGKVSVNILKPLKKSEYLSDSPHRESQAVGLRQKGKAENGLLRANQTAGAK